MIAALSVSALVLLSAVGGALLAKRLPRYLKAKIVHEVVSPIVLAVAGDSTLPDTGPPWNDDMHSLASSAALEGAARAACQGRNVTVVSLDNRQIRRSRLRFAYQDLADSKLSRLSEELRLDKVVTGSTGDLDKLRRVTSFVRELVDHTEESDSNQISYGAPQDAFSLLRAVANGQTFQCNAYTLLLIQCLAALGYVSRQSTCGYYEPREHVVIEVWSPDYGKWILLDADYDLTYVRDGIPLNAYELQRVALQMEQGFCEWAFRECQVVSCNSVDRQRLLAAYLASRPSALEGVQMIRGTAQSSRIPSKIATSPTGMFLELHRSFAVSMRNDYISRVYPLGHPRRSAQAAMPAGAARWLGDYDGVLTDDLADLYWTINCVRMGFECCDAKGTVKVQLGTFTPSFRCFRVTVNGRTEETAEPTVLWRLDPGEQSIVVSSVNARGLEGGRSRATIEVPG